MLTIGIDAGLTGAVATLDERGEFCFLADLPTACRGSLKWIDGGRFLTMLFDARDGDRPARVVVEWMHALPIIASKDNPTPTARGGGVSTASAQGVVIGAMLAILQVAELPFEIIVPQKWKRPLGLMNSAATYAQKKQASLAMARTLFPKAHLTRQKDHGRAEALLIAYWAWEYFYRQSGLDLLPAAPAGLKFCAGGPREGI